jgi:hypothetical protein
LSEKLKVPTLFGGRGTAADHAGRVDEPLDVSTQVSIVERQHLLALVEGRAHLAFGAGQLPRLVTGKSPCDCQKSRRFQRSLCQFRSHVHGAISAVGAIGRHRICCMSLLNRRRMTFRHPGCLDPGSKAFAAENQE